MIFAIACAALLAAGYFGYRAASLRLSPEDLEKKRGPHDGNAPYDAYKRMCFRGKERLDAAAEVIRLTLRTPDGLDLAGYLYEREGVKKAFVLVHGYTGDGYYDYGALGADLFDRGYNVLIVDDRAHGASGGKYVGWGVKDAEDLCGWCRMLEERYGPDAAVCITGNSMGGATVLTAGARDDLPSTVKCVVSDCAFASFIRVMTPEGSGLHRKLAIPVLAALMSVWSLLLSGYSMLSASPLKAVRHERVPVLFWHGTADTVVPLSHEKLLFDACASGKEMRVSEGAIHCGSHYVEGEKYVDSVTEFFEKHL